MSDATTQCIEACLELSGAAAEAAAQSIRCGGEHAKQERINSLVTCAAVTRMIAERLQAEGIAEDSLLTLGIEVAGSAGRICGSLDDADLRPCALAARSCVEALEAFQAQS